MEEIKKGYHVTHPSFGFAEVLWEYHPDPSKFQVKHLDRAQDDDLIKVPKDEVKVVRIKGYDGSDPVTRKDYVTVDGGGLWRVVGFHYTDDTIFDVQIEHVKTGEEKSVEPGEFKKPDDEVVESHGYRRTCGGDIVLDWTKIEIQKILDLDKRKYYFWKDHGEKYPFTEQEIRRTTRAFWSYVEDHAPKTDAHFFQSLEQDLEELLYDEADFEYSDDSFGYEYGSIVGTHSAYSAWIDLDETEVDVFVLDRPQIPEDDGTFYMCLEDRDVEFDVELDMSDIEVEEVDIGGFTFHHVTGTLVSQ